MCYVNFESNVIQKYFVSLVSITFAFTVFNLLNTIDVIVQPFRT